MTRDDVFAVEGVKRDAFIKDGAGAGEHGIPRPEETLTAQVHDRQIAILEVYQWAEVLHSVEE